MSLPSRYDPYNENVAIMGMQGSGKTTLAKKILDAMPSIPRWIWSPQRPLDLYGGYGEPVNHLSKLRRGAYVYTGEFGERNFAAFCNRAMEQANLVLVIDDVHEYVKKQAIPPEFARLINSGRNRGVCSIFLTPSPNLVHNNLLQSCQHIYCFRMGLEAQIKWLALNWYGPDAYCLLPRATRRLTPTVGNEYDVLPPHSYLYRSHTDTAATLYVNGVAVETSAPPSVAAAAKPLPGGAPDPAAGGAPPPEPEADEEAPT